MWIKAVYPTLWLGVVGWILQGAELIPLSVEQLTARAQWILQGTVESQTCQKDPAGRIYTSISFVVTDVWKGQLKTNRITLVHGGGVLGEERVQASGQVNYRVGEEAVVFAVLNPHGEAVTLGMCQGKFDLSKNGSGELIANNGYYRKAEKPQLIAEKKAAVGQSPRLELTLSQLKQRVQAVQP